MKLYAILMVEQNNNVLAEAFDVSSFGFFEKGTVKEFIHFFTKTIVEYTELGEHKSVHQDKYIAHVYKSSIGTSVVVVSDLEYPQRVVFTLMNKLLDSFIDNGPDTVFCELQEYIIKYQNPVEADSLMKINKELDETKEILCHTIDSVIQRAELLDNLIDKSNELSNSSKIFYKTAKKMNSCCTLL